MKTTQQYNLRFFDHTKDYELLNDWSWEHGKPPPPQTMLPMLGAVAQKDGEDIALLFLYMDNSVGVCWAEYPTTKPALPLKDSVSALLHLLEFMKKAAAANNYGMMRVTTHPAIARYLKREGFIPDMENMTTMFAPTGLKKEEDDGNRC